MVRQCCRRAQEASWLRVALNQWLDDEFCPEPTNVVIAERCAHVYQRCLRDNNRDLASILMQVRARAYSCR